MLVVFGVGVVVVVVVGVVMNGRRPSLRSISTTMQAVQHANAWRKERMKRGGEMEEKHKRKAVLIGNTVGPGGSIVLSSVIHSVCYCLFGVHS